jgi:hypothetical protein
MLFFFYATHSSSFYLFLPPSLPYEGANLGAGTCGHFRRRERAWKVQHGGGGS